jgi:hypothetical protein
LHTRDQIFHEIRHAKGVRKIEQARHLLGFRYRNIPIVNPSELIGAHRAVIRLLYEIEDERDRENGDHDHQPMTMPAQ